MTATATATANGRAVALMAGAMVVLAANDAVIKHVGSTLPVGQITGLRGLMLCTVLTVVCLAARERIEARRLLDRWCLIRGACETCGVFLFFTSLQLVPLAVATTLVLIAPVALTALSGPMFGERVGAWRWGAVIAGFIGVAIITAPGSATWEPALLLPIGTAVAVIARDLATRRIPADVSSSTAALGTALVVTTAGLASAARGWPPVDPTSIAWLALASVFIAGAYLGTVMALRLGELSVVAPVNYLLVPCAVAFGVIGWGEIPSARESVGGVIIIGANLAIAHRERVRGRP